MTQLFLAGTGGNAKTILGLEGVAATDDTGLGYAKVVQVDASGNAVASGAGSTSLLASASRTTTQTSADITNPGGRWVQVVLDMTVVGTGSVTVSINFKDAASGKYINLLTGAAITTNSTNRYRVHPNLAAVANSVAQDLVPRTIQIVVTANNANPATYTVGYEFGN